MKLLQLLKAQYYIVDSHDQRWLCNVNFDDSELAIAWNTNNDEIVLYKGDYIVAKVLPGVNYDAKLKFGATESHVTFEWWNVN